MKGKFIMDQSSLIYVAGHTGMVGDALVRLLKAKGYNNLLLRTHSEVDLIDQLQVKNLFAHEKPQYVFLAAANVGGIMANQNYPADLLYNNLMIYTNIINSAKEFGVDKLLFIGSSCSYPKFSKIPITEDQILSGPLERTNEPFAVAKIAGIKLCDSYNRQFGTNFIAVMPTNLFGPGDDFDLESSHVVGAFLRKFHQAKENNEKHVTIWGTGSPLREFLYVDDLADALIYLMENLDASEVGELINIGSGLEYSILQLAEMIKGVVDFDCEILLDTTKPDGTHRKLIDSSRIKSVGWSPKINLELGLDLTYQWCLNNGVFN